MKKIKNKEKNTHSIPQNIFYIVKLMFSISPWLVITEISLNIFHTIPVRLVSVIGIKYIIDEVQKGETDGIIRAVIAIAVILLLSNILNGLIFEIYIHRERENLYRGIHSKLYEKAMKLDLKKYDDPKFYSDFILAIETSSENIHRILMLVRGYITEIVSFVTIGAIVVTIDWVCLVIVLVFVLAFVPLGRKTGNLQMEFREKTTEKRRRSDYFARVFYLPEYAGETRMNGIIPLLMQRFRESADEESKTQRKYVKKIDWMFFIQDASVQVIGFMLVLTGYIGYCTLVTKTMSAGDFVATFNGAVQIGSAVLYLTVYAIRNFTERSKMIEKYRVFLSTETEMKDGEHIAECGKPKKIELKNVSFRYEGSDKNALEDITMTINPGEKVALVGYNGAGKTTLTNLLLRLYDVDSGEIIIDGRNIKDETIDSHRDRFAAVFQDFKIFGATMGENVALDVDYNEERVLEALKHAGFKKELPDGVNTVLLREFSDDGMMLSGGEEQKVAIARAFYKQCPFVILDEPSANLDPISEYELNQSMIEAAEDKTVIFISHRLSTTRNADRIFMMENGRIIESGSHDELMKLNGKYAYMFNLQAEKYRTEVITQ